MKKYLILLIFCLNNLTFGDPIKNYQIEPTALVELVSTLGLAADQDILEQTQKHWLRKPGHELWELEELSAHQRSFVLDWARKNQLFADWKPACQSYDKALIFGATTVAMERRLAYLIQLWKEGIRFNEIVWLTGKRPLDPRVDGLVDRCQDESEAARVLWDEVDLPTDMRKLPVVYIDVPMIAVGNSFKRPNTADTIFAWLDQSPNPCKVFFVSNQPFCGYQFAVVKTCLPKEFSFDLVGSGFVTMSHRASAAVILDSLARWLYQENIYAKKQF